MASPPPPGGGAAALSNSYLKICSDIGCQPMPELLAALTSGQRYCLISSPSESLADSSVISLCAVLPMAPFELCSFHNLSLSSNSWAAIADACSKTRPLQRVVFKDCSFRDGQGMHMFSRALSAADLQSLEIINSQLGDEFVAGLVEGSLLANEKFTTLRLAGCGLGDAGSVRLAKAIEGVGMMCSLRVLDLSHNRIGDAGACALASMLGIESSASSVPLNTLELEGNLLSDVGGLALCRAAKAALMLQRLNLSLNPGLGSATMVSLAEAVRFNTGTLREVALAGCRASEDAAVALLRAAARSSTLQLLDIRGVPLSAEGVAHLCTLLRNTTSLNTLRVDVASTEGAEAIARDLPSNRSLMHITLGGPVPDGLLTAMSEILANNTVRRLNSTSGSPQVTNSPLIHAWMDDSNHGTSVAGARHSNLPFQTPSSYPSIYTSQQPQSQPPSHVANIPSINVAATPSQSQQLRSSRPHSPIPQHAAEHTRSPRSEAGASVYSHATHRTSRTHRTHRTSTSYISFGGFTDMTRRTIMLGSTRLRVSASLAAGGAAEKAALIFRSHDQDEDNYLNKQEMLAALEEMGVLNGIKAKHIGRFLDGEFKKADWDKDGRISLQDFISYYEKIAYYQAQMAREGRIKSMANLNKQMVPQGVEHNAHLKSVFKNYARLAIGQGRVYADGQPQMNSAQFHRLCQDAGFMEPDGRLSTTAVDVIFTRYRAANSRRLAFKDFIAALAAAAYEMGFQFDDILEVLGANRSQQPLTPTESGAGVRAPQPHPQRDNVSDSGGAHYLHPTGQQQQQKDAQLSADPSIDVLGVPLATVHEGSEGKKATAAKGKASKKASGTRSSVQGVRSSQASAGRANNPTSISNNPLYDSQDAPIGSTGPAHSSFAVGNVNGQGQGQGQGNQSRSRFTAGSASPGRFTSTGSGPAAPSSSDLAMLETRMRLEVEAAVRQLEERLERQLVTARSSISNGTNGGNGLPASADALMGAKLRQLEGQVSGLLSRQDEMDRVAQQLGGLQDILNRLAEEMVRIKNRADAAAATAASAASAASSAGANGNGNVAAFEERLGNVSAQLGGVREGVEALGRDLGALGARVEALSGQVSTSRSTSQQQASSISQLQQQLSQLAAQVASQQQNAAAAAAAPAPTAQLEALEKKVMNRLTRYDGALLQVAKQVDALDQRLREEQEGNIKTIEMLLVAAGGGNGAASGAAAAAGQNSAAEIRPASNGSVAK
ncbi:hypothetical protein Agub_g5018 [Astrephomene gubernaculifera]|uniref:EF-hand domain-containing protein n=1 Tax=Astrephomene gubernaculifera TaxID=47775 RepID=A0AAD3DL67_9CHLO|nr:hypothetical protein Agub_g5018 [Astrephomene gubernaculifera]